MDVQKQIQCLFGKIKSLGNINEVPTYKALLNKGNATDVIPTVLKNTLPSSVTVNYNESVFTGTWTTDILIGHPVGAKLFIPLFFSSGESVFDDKVTMYLHNLTPTETIVHLEFNLEDFQILHDFPFLIEFYP